VRLNAVVIRGVNHEETADLVAFALACGCEQRFIELMPTGLPPRRYREWFVPADEILRALGARFALAPLPQPPGSSSRRYRVTASRGRIGAIGLISPTTRPFCAGCRRLRLTADGRLVGCLGRRETVPVRHLLRDGAAEETIVHAAAAALACKRSLTFTPPVVMSAVGG
jgi:cyclic pyranopterin phosphate synthase